MYVRVYCSGISIRWKLVYSCLLQDLLPSLSGLLLLPWVAIFSLTPVKVLLSQRQHLKLPTECVTISNNNYYVCIRICSKKQKGILLYISLHNYKLLWAYAIWELQGQLCEVWRLNAWQNWKYGAFSGPTGLKRIEIILCTIVTLATPTH